MKSREKVNKEKRKLDRERREKKKILIDKTTL